MISKRTKTFIVEGKEVQFDTSKFKELFCRYAMKKDALKGEYEFELAELLCVENSAIHNWRMGLNGPGDLEKIHKLEKYWHLAENSLLTEVIMENVASVKKPLSDAQRDFIRRAYNAYRSIAYEFDVSLGFQYAIDLDEIMDSNLKDEDRTPYDIKHAQELLYDYYNLIEEEGFFVLNKELYEIMLEFLDNVRTLVHGDLEEIYDVVGLEKEKMSYEELLRHDLATILTQGFRDSVALFLAI